MSKKQTGFAVIIIILATLGAESLPVFGLSAYKPVLKLRQEANEYVLTWPRLHYPALYVVDVLNSPPPDSSHAAPKSIRIARFWTLDNCLNVDCRFPFHTYWRVGAYGIFRHPVGTYSNALEINAAQSAANPNPGEMKPVPTSFYPLQAPAPEKPVLTWTSVPGAIYYELEFLKAPPENPNGIQPSAYRIGTPKKAFANGINVDLSEYKVNRLFWRVRALDYDDNPLGVFSDAAEINIDRSLGRPLKPVIVSRYDDKDFPPPLYPVYSWIPIVGAVSYEVELLRRPPENPNGTSPSQYRIWSKRVAGSDCYDDEPRNSAGVYYWRVRGLDASGDPVGVFSDAVPFTVRPELGRYAATFGDSITHGGGAISYSPANWEYSYQSYLNFPVLNLGRSGDTSETMVERFDRDVLPFRPKYLIIMGGINSIREGVPAEKVIEDLSAIRKKCVANNIRPIFLTLPPINPAAIYRVFGEETVPDWQRQLEAVNSFIRQQRYYIDLYPYFTDSNGELPARLAVDGLHFDIAGKKLMAQIINAGWEIVTR